MTPTNPAADDIIRDIVSPQRVMQSREKRCSPMHSPETRDVSAQTTHTDGDLKYEYGYLRAAMHERPHEKKFNDSRDSEIQKKQRGTSGDCTRDAMRTGTTGHSRQREICSIDRCTMIMMIEIEDRNSIRRRANRLSVSASVSCVSVSLSRNLCHQLSLRSENATPRRHASKYYPIIQKIKFTVFNIYKEFKLFEEIVF